MPDPSQSPSSSRPPFQTVSPVPTDSAAAVDVPPARWNAIVADLAARGVDGVPTLVSATAQTWPTGALGCPKPGASYTQAVVEGMQVIVEVDGIAYDYRFGRTDEPVLCER